MSSPGQLLAFMALSFLIIVIPGPTLIRLVGAVYLVYLGVRAWRERGRPAISEAKLQPQDPWLFLLGLIFALIALASDSVWGLPASQARQWFGRSPRRLAMVGGSGGLALIGPGVGIVVTGRRH